VRSNERTPFVRSAKVNEGQPVVEPAATAVSETWVRPDRSVSLSQAPRAALFPVLFRYRRKVTVSPGFGSPSRARRIAVKFDADSRPYATKYMSVPGEAGVQPPP